MLWGLTLPPGQPYSVTVDEEVQVSMVALESRGTFGAFGQVPVQITVKTGKAEFLLCTLIHGQLYQQIVDVKLSPKEKVVFCAHGTGLIHITGYTKQYVEDEMFDDSYLEVEPPDDESGPGIGMEEGWQPIPSDGSNMPDPLPMSRVHPVVSVHEESAVLPQLQSRMAVATTGMRSTQETCTSGSEQPQNLPAVSHASSGMESFRDVDVKEEESHFVVIPDTSMTFSSPQRLPASALTSSTSTPKKPTAVTSPSTSAYPHPVSLQRGTSEPSTSSASERISGSRKRSLDEVFHLHLNSRLIKDDKEFTSCKTCAKKFISKEELRQHELSQEHKKRINNICTVCSRGFQSRSLLVVHERIHTNVRPFKCSRCEKTFTQQGHLKTHELSHLRYEKLDCKFCKTRFRYEVDCERHMMTCKNQDFPVTQSFTWQGHW